jgi:hypothetical protein
MEREPRVHRCSPLPQRPPGGLGGPPAVVHVSPSQTRPEDRVVEPWALEAAADASVSQASRASAVPRSASASEVAATSRLAPARVAGPTAG